MIKSETNQVSVIIPTWNRAALLKKAIRSALNQSFPPMEIIVSDDGSTDDSYEMVRAFDNPKIKWITGGHNGLPAVVRNRALKACKGNWIAFLDSDDEWIPEKLEKQLALAKNSGCLAICSNAYSVNRKGDKRKYLGYTKKIITFSDLVNVNYVICSSALIYRSLLNKCYGFPESSAFKTGQDYALWLRISTQTVFAYHSKPLVLYLDDPSNSNRRFTKNPYLQKISIVANFMQWGWKEKISFNYMQQAFICYINSIKNLLLSLISF